jgi:hypothetical protein
VTILDRNEPPIVSISYSRSVAENSPAGTLIGTPISASDVDAGPSGDLTFSLPAAPPQFVIDPVNGQLRTGSTVLDFEVKASYDIAVRVTDGGTPPLAVSSTVTISVVDKNDSPFMPIMVLYMDESSPAGTVVPSSALLGTDEDSSDNNVANPLTYVMVAHVGSTGAADLIVASQKFEIITSSSGAPVLRLQSLSAGLNYETLTSYMFNIQVSDDQVPIPSTDSSLCTINVNNINEIPVFTAVCTGDSSYAYCFGVDENSAGGINVGTQVTVQDPDVGQSQTFSITSSSPTANAFTVVAATGQLQVSSSTTRDLLDHESSLFVVGGATEYAVQIQATDDGILQIGAGATKTVASTTSLVASLRITIKDINERPSFPSTPPSYPNRPSTFPETRWLTLDENIGNSVVLGGTIQATDPDDPTTTWGQLTYDLVGTSALFEMVCDANECKSTTGSVQLQTKRTGVLSFDFETLDSYIINLKVSDGDSTSPLSDTAEYRIAVLDINELPVLNDVTLTVEENSVDDTAVGTRLIATDDDLKRCTGTGASLVCTDSTIAQCTGSCQSLDYQIVSQTPCLDSSNSDPGACLAFKVDRCAGQVSVSVGHLIGRPLDYETQPTYTMVVEVTDDGRPTKLSDTATVTVTIIDVNESPTILPQSVSIAENSAVDTPVGVPLTTSDVDGTTSGTVSGDANWGVVSFSIVSGASSLFQVDATTGQVSVKSPNLNYEPPTTSARHQVKICARSYFHLKSTMLKKEATHHHPYYHHKNH